MTDKILLDSILDIFGVPITTNTVNDIIEPMYTTGDPIFLPVYEDQTPLKIAIISGRDDLFDYFISLGATVDITDLILAIYNDNVNAILSLLKLDVNPNVVYIDTNNIPHNPLGLAFVKGKMDIVDSLIAYGADINYDDGIKDHTPLAYFLTFETTIERLQAMFNRGLTIDRSPYEYICDLLAGSMANLLHDNHLVRKIKGFIKLLLQHGAYAGESIDNIYSPFEYAINLYEFDRQWEGEGGNEYFEEFEDIASILIESGILLSERDKSLMYYLFNNSHYRAFKYIIDNNLIDINASTYIYQDETLPLIIVAILTYKNGGDDQYPDFIRFLFNKDVNMNVTYDRHSILDLIYEDTWLLSAFIDAGGNINNNVTHNGITMPLIDYYYDTKRIFSIELILKNGYNFFTPGRNYIADTFNLSPFESGNQRSIIRELLKRGFQI